MKIRSLSMFGLALLLISFGVATILSPLFYVGQAPWPIIYSLSLFPAFTVLAIGIYIMVDIFPGTSVKHNIPAKLQRRINDTYLIYTDGPTFELIISFRELGVPLSRSRSLSKSLNQLLSVIGTNYSWYRILKKHYDWEHHVLFGIASACTHLKEKTPAARIEDYLEAVAKEEPMTTAYKKYIADTFIDSLAVAALAALSGIIELYSIYNKIGTVDDYLKELTPLYIPKRGNIIRNLAYLSCYLQKQIKPDLSASAIVQLNITALRYLLALCNLERIPLDFCVVQRLKYHCL